MDAACRNIMTHTNCGIAQAFLMAARNPARVIGMDHEIGTIEIGKKANLVMVDHRFHVKMTILEGEVWNKKE
jgi:N-acetylglucosamine-6-phosphate deacetylase